MQSRAALVLAGLALAISILAMSSVGGAGNLRHHSTAPSAAYALVNSDDNGGGFVTKSGFKSVSYEGDGNYCLSLAGKASFSGRVAIVAPEDGLSGIDDAVAKWQSTNEDCPAGTIQVETTDSSDTSSSAVAFTVLVP